MSFVIVSGISHLDHNLSLGHLEFAKNTLVERTGFFIETLELPLDLAGLPCELYGPLIGDDPVPESEVTYVVRGDRKGATRCVSRPPRASRLMTVIAGPNERECPTCGGKGTLTFIDSLTEEAGGQGGVRDCLDCAGLGKQFWDCVMYTAFGGPPGEREPWDESISDWETLLRSRKFWKTHALAKP